MPHTILLRFLSRVNAQAKEQPALDKIHSCESDLQNVNFEKFVKYYHL